MQRGDGLFVFARTLGCRGLRLLPVGEVLLEGFQFRAGFLEGTGLGGLVGADFVQVGGQRLLRRPRLSGLCVGV